MSAPRWRIQALAGMVSVALVLVILLIAAHRLGPKHLLVVEPGVLYRSAVLPPSQLEEVVDRYGIRTVVNLRSTRENGLGGWHAAEAGILEQKGVRLLDLPMDSGFPPNDAVLAEWLELLEDEDEQPILVHCEYGVIRTGIMVAVYDMTHRDHTGRQALEDFELFSSTLEEPIRSRIVDFVASYEEVREAAKAGGEGS